MKVLLRKGLVQVHTDEDTYTHEIKEEYPIKVNFGLDELFKNTCYNICREGIYSPQPGIMIPLNCIKKYTLLEGPNFTETVTEEYYEGD